MIAELTPEQIAKFDHYVKKWSDIGRAYGQRADRDKVTQYVHDMYKQANLAVPGKILFFDSITSLIDAAANDYGVSKSTIYGDLCYGNQDADFLAPYDYLMNEVGVTGLEPHIPLANMATEVSWFLPLEDAIYISERPKVIHFNENGMHKDGGFALEYFDGTGIYCLNGVIVPAEVALTPADQLDPKWILKEKNVEVRREILRKIGTERAVTALSTGVLHKDQVIIGQGTPFERIEQYELLNIDLGEGASCPALKMQNPSVDATHIEFVGRSCKTVQDALAFRMQMVTNSFVAPKVLT